MLTIILFSGNFLCSFRLVLIDTLPAASLVRRRLAKSRWPRLLSILGRKGRPITLSLPSTLNAIPLLQLLRTILPTTLSCPLTAVLLSAPVASVVNLLVARLHRRLVLIEVDRIASACALSLMTTLRSVRYLRYPSPAKHIGEVTSLPQGPVGLSSSRWARTGAIMPRNLPSILPPVIGAAVRFPQQKLQLFDLSLFGPTCLLGWPGMTGVLGQQRLLLTCCRRKFFRRWGA